MEKLCPQCGRSFTEDIASCPDDGAALIGDETASLTGRVIENRFTVGDLISTGGMGSVYIAVQHSVGREIALKVLKPELASSLETVKRFLAEARVASRLTNPHTVSLYDFGRTPEGTLYIAMELLRGATLRQALEQDGPLAEPRAVSVAMQMCESLAEAHAMGLVHRDVKPDNVFLLQPGTAREFVKVLDFGIAKSLADPSQTTITRAGVVCGTPDYMSPEHVTGHGVTPASDVYSAGIVLYQMLSGAVPFTGDSAMQIMMKHAGEMPPPLRPRMGGRSLSFALERLVERCLSKRPGDRPADAAALLQELTALAAAPALPASSPEPAIPSIHAAPTLFVAAPVLPVPPPRRRGVLVAGLLGAAALAAGLTFALRRDEPPSSPPAAAVSVAVPPAERPLPPVRAAPPPVVEDERVQLVSVDAGAAVVAPDAGPALVAAVVDAGAPAPDVAPAAPVAPRTRAVRVESTPNGAEVVVRRRILGPTPITVDVPEAGVPVTLRRRGYEDLTVRLAWAGPVRRTFRLSPDDDTALRKASQDGLK